jgi:hypothetical protein
MEVDQSFLTALTTIKQRRENTLTLVRSLIQEGKIEEAMGEVRQLRGTDLWKQACEFFRPSRDPLCTQGHTGTWEQIDLLWVVDCRRCEEEQEAQRQAKQAAYDEERRQQREEERADRRNKLEFEATKNRVSQSII